MKKYKAGQYPKGALRIMNFGGRPPRFLVYEDPCKAPVAGPFKTERYARKVIARLEGRKI